MKYKFVEILIDERIANHPTVNIVLENLSDIPVFRGDDEAIHNRIACLDLEEGKKRIHLTVDSGQLVKPCPATNPPYICCRYTVINSANQCPMDCTYCVLQNYLEGSVITVFVNEQDILNELEQLFHQSPRRFFRIGTGELADSLALDLITKQTPGLIEYFNNKRNCLFEVKTKTDHIDNILRSDPANVVAAWSVNPQKVMSREELRAASLSKRLAAAKKCQDHGCLLAFHFDPILELGDENNLYQETVDEIFSSVSSERIAWISLGALRYPPDLKEVIHKRFPASKIIYDEMIRGLDGKMRYIRPKRLELFKIVYERIRKHSPDVFVYFCMEPPWVWDKIMGFHPACNADLDYRFARSIFSRFPELDMDEPEKQWYT